MIRPFTCVCLLLAGGSGLYLYQSKHRVQMLDHEIEGIVRAADVARARTGVLRAEWTLMNDPERLGQLADKFLPLRTTAPGQFTTMADLDNRLPAVRPPEPAHFEPTDEDASVVAEAPKPEPVKVAAVPHPAPAAPAPVQAKAAPAAKPHPVQVAAQTEPRAPVPQAVTPAYAPPAPYTQVASTSLGRPPSYAPPAYAPPAYTPPAYAAPRPPVATQVAAPPAQVVGSSLGMARTMTPLPYRPSE